jgi:hypothetical protein
MTVIDHGATVKFTATFKDEDGNPATPSSATVYVSYANISTGAWTKQTIAMSGGSTMTATWASNVAMPQHGAYWNLRASGGGNDFSEFGAIEFDWNRAGLPDA